MHWNSAAIDAFESALRLQHVKIAANAGLGGVQFAAKSLQIEEVLGLEHLADSELPFSSFHRAVAE